MTNKVWDLKPFLSPRGAQRLLDASGEGPASEVVMGCFVEEGNKNALIPLHGEHLDDLHRHLLHLRRHLETLAGYSPYELARLLTPEGAPVVRRWLGEVGALKGVEERVAALKWPRGAPVSWHSRAYAAAFALLRRRGEERIATVQRLVLACIAKGLSSGDTTKARERILKSVRRSSQRQAGGD